MTNAPQNRGENFADDLAFGEKAEIVVLHWIREHEDETAFRMPGNHIEWDIKAPEIDRTYEVKAQPDAHEQYGHISVEAAISYTPHRKEELENQRSNIKMKKSGILASTASHWVWYTGHEFIMVEADALRELIKPLPKKEWQNAQGYVMAGKTPTVASVRDIAVETWQDNTWL